MEASQGHETTRRMARPVPRLSLTLEEAAESTGLSRTRLFGAVREEKLTVRKDGKSTIVELDELQRYVRSLPTRGRPTMAGDEAA